METLTLYEFHCVSHVVVLFRFSQINLGCSMVIHIPNNALDSKVKRVDDSTFIHLLRYFSPISDDIK